MWKSALFACALLASLPALADDGITALERRWLQLGVSSFSVQ